MGITHESGLFALINQLTIGEKRYIRQYINQRGEQDSNYAKLFTAAVKSDACDEEKLKKKLKKTTVVKQWSRNKNYLYNYLLRILQHYNQQNLEFEVTNNLQQVKILYSKGLYHDAYKLLKKTKQLVLKGESPTLLPFVAEWEMRLGRVIWYDEEIEVLDYPKNNKQAIGLAENLLAIQKLLVDVIGNVVQKEKGRYMRVAQSNLELLQEGILSSTENAKSPMAKWYFYSIKSGLCSQIKQYNNALFLAKKGVLLHETYPLLQQHAPFSYMTSLSNFTIAVLDSKQWEEMPFVLQKIDTHLKSNKAPTIQLILSSVKYMVLLKYYIGTKDFEGGLAYAEEILQFLRTNKKENDSYTRRRVLLHYLIIIYVINSKFNEALGLIEQLEHTQRIAISRNAMLLMKLICLFELEEILQLPYVVRSIYRGLLKKKDLFEFERIVLNLLKASANIASKDALKKVFSKYLVQLNKLVKTAPKPELELLEHFDFLAWMESKVENRPLIEILKGRSSQVI